jgi:hypothetical protein
MGGHARLFHQHDLYLGDAHCFYATNPVENLLEQINPLRREQARLRHRERNTA